MVKHVQQEVLSLAATERRLLSRCKYIMKPEKRAYFLLKIYGDIFDGTAGTWNTNPVYFKLRDDENPICLCTNTAPKIYEVI